MVVYVLSDDYPIRELWFGFAAATTLVDTAVTSKNCGAPKNFQKNSPAVFGLRTRAGRGSRPKRLHAEPEKAVSALAIYSLGKD